MGLWQKHKKLTVLAGGTATFALGSRIATDRLTIWAVSGNRVLTSMTFQARINGFSYNPAVTVTAAEAIDVIYRSGGALSENDMIPYIPAETPIDSSDPFVFDILVSNGSGVAETVTLIAVGYGG